MKKKKWNHILLITIAIFITQSASPQGFFKKIKRELDTMTIRHQHKRADRFYEGLAYPKAIHKYEKIIDKGFAPDSVKRNLAVSYFKISETKKSEEIFKELINGNKQIPMDLYYYAQALKYNQKYEEADIWMEKYKAIQNQDKRAILQQHAAPVIEEIYHKERYEIEEVSFNSEYSDFGAVVLGDEIVFASGRNDQAIIQYEYAWKEAPYLDLYTISKEGNKTAKVLVRGINTRFHEGPACFNDAGDEMFLTRNNFNLGLPKYSSKKENHFMLYHTKRNGNKWGNLEELPFNSREYSCGHPFITPDNQVLYFASDMPGGYGESDIYYTVRTDSGWSQPVNLGQDINTEGDEMFPFISQTGELYFASNGHLGLGGLDIFIAKAEGKNSYTVKNAGYPLNSSNDDFGLFIEKDGKTGYFASNREGGKGDDDIYRIKILSNILFALKLQGNVTDSLTKEPLKGAKVILKDHNGTTMKEVQAEENAAFNFSIEPELSYILEISHQGYPGKTETIEPSKLNEQNGVIKYPVALYKEPGYGIYGQVFIKETMEPVAGVKLSIQEKDKTAIQELLTDHNGSFRTSLEEATDYELLFTKKDFFTIRENYTTIDKKPGYVNLNEFIDLVIEKIEVDKTIEIPNIYYDLGKWNIRPDAAVELANVVQFLSDNPNIKIELGSHTDARGSSASNQALSQKRAESAVNYIVAHGIDKSRISAKGYGESKIKNRCADGIKCTEEEHQENRRTEIRIVGF